MRLGRENCGAGTSFWHERALGIFQVLHQAGGALEGGRRDLGGWFERQTGQCHCVVAPSGGDSGSGFGSAYSKRVSVARCRS